MELHLDKRVTHLCSEPLKTPVVLGIQIRALEPREDLLDALRHLAELTVRVRWFRTNFARDIQKLLREECTHLGGFVSGKEDGLTERSGSESDKGSVSPESDTSLWARCSLSVEVPRLNP